MSKIEGKIRDLNFIRLECIKGCGTIRRDIENNPTSKWTAHLLKLYCVKTPIELQKVYVCRSCRSGKIKALKQEHVVEQLKSEIHSETHSENSDKYNMSYLIPKTETKYISRRIRGMSDTDLLEQAYNFNLENFDKPNEELYNILIVGDCGSGKSHCARWLSYKLKLPYKRINLNGATTPEDLVGQFIPNGSIKSYKWVDGWLTRFMRHGGILVLDEINMAQADILAILNPILDRERTLILTQCDGEAIKAHPKFFCISSLPYNEQVFMQDGINKIGDIVETNYQKYKDEITHNGNNFVLNTKDKGIFCYSFNPNSQKNELKEVTALLKHKPVDNIFEIKLENGKKCKVTGSHSVFSDIGKPIKVDKLKVGDSIVVPTKFENNNQKNGIFDFKLLRDIYTEKPIVYNDKFMWWGYSSPHKINRFINLDNEDLFWLLGFWIAEGSFCSTINNHSAKLDVISFTNKKKKLILRCKNIVKKIFGCNSYLVKDKRTDVYNLAICSKVISYFFRYLGLTTNCYNKKIPSLVFKSQNNLIKAFLYGMLDGDGSKGSKYRHSFLGFNCYNTTSKILANQTAYICLFLGIQTSIYKRIPKNTDDEYTRKPCYTVYAKSETISENTKKLKIKSIKKIKKFKDFVYDFEVSNDGTNDNFIGGFGGIMLHNTMNLNYEGTKPLNEALKDRFNLTLEFEYDPKVEQKLISNKKLLDFAVKLRLSYKNSEIMTPLSTRTLLAFQRNIATFGVNVAESILFNRFEKAERKVVEEIWRIIKGEQEQPKEEPKGAV